jgi:thiamine biosynthesis protein ThiS
MHIILNGDAHELPGPLSVRALLDLLGVDPRVVAVEINREIVRRARYADTMVTAGAEVEVVAFVGGGSPGVRGLR